jgi:hypothetical protein
MILPSQQSSYYLPASCLGYSIELPLTIFFPFTFVEIPHWSKVPYHPSPHFGLLTTNRTHWLFSYKISMILTRAEGGSKRNIGKLIVGKYCLEQPLGDFDRLDALPKVEMQHRPPGILAL